MKAVLITIFLCVVSGFLCDRGIAVYVANHGIPFLGDRDSLSLYNFMIAHYPANSELYWRRGLVEYYLGDFRSAELDYDRSISLFPNCRNFTRRGDLHTHAGKIEKAISDYDRAITFHCEYSLAYSGRGLAKEKLQDFDGAMRDYNAAIGVRGWDTNADSATAYASRGRLKEKLFGRTKAVEADYRETYNRDPRRFQTLWSMFKH